MCICLFLFFSFFLRLLLFNFLASPVKLRHTSIFWNLHSKRSAREQEWETEMGTGRGENDRDLSLPNRTALLAVSRFVEPHLADEYWTNLSEKGGENSELQANKTAMFISSNYNVFTKYILQHLVEINFILLNCDEMLQYFDILIR